MGAESNSIVTRRTFLSGASRAALAPVMGAALVSCATSSPRRRAKSAERAPANASLKTIRPPKGQVLFIAGQGGSQLGGRPAEGQGDGYLDHMSVAPAGFTMYCSVAEGVDTGDLSRVSSIPALRDSVLHLSVGWVPDFDKAAQRNNQAITAGEFDKNIDELAMWCAAQPRPILMRIGYEFDRGGPYPNYHYDPAYFAQGFRRIVDRYRAGGAHNVASVFASSNAPGYSPVLTTERFNRFYPGDDYVDWLGCSMFWPDWIDHVMFSEARKRDKPVLLAETTPMKYNIGRRAYYPGYVALSRDVSAQQIWDGWHQPMVDFIKANLDVIAGWHYIAADWSTDGMWNWVPFFTNCDARPWANPQFLEIWNQHINAAPFLQASPGLFRQMGYGANPREGEAPPSRIRNVRCKHNGSAGASPSHLC